MKKIGLILTFLTLSIAFSYGQTASDTITMVKVFGGYQFYQGYKRLNVNQLVKTMEPNAEAYRQIKSAKSNYTLANILGGAGGFMIGWPLGTQAGGGEANWAMAGAGVGLILLAIPASQSFNKQAKQAVETYNSGFQTSSFWNKSELSFSMTGNGIGLRLRF